MNRKFVITLYETGEPVVHIVSADNPEGALACCTILGGCLEGELVSTEYDYPDEIRQAFLDRTNSTVH